MPKVILKSLILLFIVNLHKVACMLATELTQSQCCILLNFPFVLFFLQNILHFTLLLQYTHFVYTTMWNVWTESFRTLLFLHFFICSTLCFSRPPAPPSILPSQEEQDPTSLLSRPVASQIHPGSSGTSRCSHFYLVLLPGPGVWKSNFPPVSLRCNQVVYDYIHIHMYIYMGKPSYLSLKREKSFSLGFFQAS